MPPLPSLTALETLAVKAGKAIMDLYEGGDLPITLKEDSSPVTQADLAAADIIRAGLKALTPHIPVVDEEMLPQRPVPQGDFWLVDPLDGTRSFIAHEDEFTVNIAYIHQKRPLLGVIYVPTTEEIYIGREGQGAYYRQHPSAPSTRITTRHPPMRWVVMSSRFHGSSFQDNLKKLHYIELVTLSSSWKFCHLAKGVGDFYARFSPTCEWDTAAGQAIVSAAGGQVFLLDGMTPLSYGKDSSWLNPSFFVCGSSEHAMAFLKLLKGCL